VYLGYFLLYSQGRAENGGIVSPVLSKGLTFHHSIIGNFIVNKI